MRILFLVPYPTEGPSNRYRVEQYLPYLEAAGISYRLSPFMDSRYYSVLYKKGKDLLKIIYFFKSSFNRLADVFRVFMYDAVFIHIEAFPIGPPLIEWLFSKIKKPVIFDFEDAIYLPRKNRISNFFKNPSKFFKTVRISRHVLVCNSYLKDFLSAYNPRVTSIPTPINTKIFQPPVQRNYSREKIIIGWIGTHTTLPLLLGLKGVFQRLAQKYRIAVKIVGAGQDVKMEGVEILNEEWTLQGEVESFKSIDIGVYPLPDNEWAKAKTPFKTIQYMSVGMACVVSKAGANADIVKDGVNGFLAETEEEWLEKLSRLIEDGDLRKRIGLSGRKTVEERYSLEAAAPNFLHIIEEVCKRN